jgi:hypothetical protein
MTERSIVFRVGPGEAHTAGDEPLAALLATVAP